MTTCSAADMADIAGNAGDDDDDDGDDDVHSEDQAVSMQQGHLQPPQTQETNVQLAALGSGPPQVIRPGIVHRIDKGTSGAPSVHPPAIKTEASFKGWSKLH